MSPEGNHGRLSVLIFHRVLAAPDPLFPDEIDAHRFEQICTWLKSWFNTIPLDEAIIRMKVGTLPARAACITFDDGYADNHRVALPILLRHGLTATFFIATGFLDGRRMWNDTVTESIRRTKLQKFAHDSVLSGTQGSLSLSTTEDRRAAISRVISDLKYSSIADRTVRADQIARLLNVQPPNDLMMTSDEVRAQRKAGMQIGAHTVSHPILAKLSRSAAYAEIFQSKQTLEGILGERVGLFAYPNGKPQVDYSNESADIVRELGFDAAVSTRWAAANATTDRFQLPRFTPWDKTRLRFGMRMIKNLRLE